MICPNCQVDAKITEQLFGSLYTCRSCSAVYFINFEGQPEFSDISNEGDEPAGSIGGQIFQEPTSLSSDLSSYESSLEPLIDSIDVVSFDNKLDQQFEMQSSAQLSEQPESQEAFLENFNIGALDKSSSSFSDIAKEISDFGNTETQLAGLNYDLKITGLDTQESKRLFQEVIEDSKLAFDSMQIMKNIKNGQIEFLKLNPVKAYILSKRLQFLDIEKHWRQNAMS